MPRFQHAQRWAGALLPALALIVLAPSVAHGQGGTSDLTIDKSGPSTVAADEDVTYSITVANAGPDTSDPVTISDPLPVDTTFVSLTQTTGPAFSCTTPGVGAAGTVTCTNPGLGNGASATFTLVAHTDPGIAPGGFVTNQAEVTTSGFDPAEENNESTASAFITGGTNADVGVAVDAPDKAAAGTDVVYAITVSNGGPDAADVSLTDVLPSDLTFVSVVQTTGPGFSCSTPAVGTTGTVSCSTVAVASQGTATFRLTARIPPGTPTGTEATNVASVSTTATDLSNDNDTATSTTTVSSADLAVDVSAPATVRAGQDLTYTLSLTNNGPDAADQPVLFADLPAGTTFVSFAQTTGSGFVLRTPQVGAAGRVEASRTSPMPASQTATFTLVVRVDERSPDGTFTLTATSDQLTADPTAANDDDTASTAVAALAADLATGVTAPASVTAGENLTFKLTFVNDGPETAFDAVLSDALPANTTLVSLAQDTGQPFTLSGPAAGATGTVTATRASWASGESATFTLVVRVAEAAAGSALVNSVTSSQLNDDPDTGNDTQTATVAAVAPPVIPAPLPPTVPPAAVPPPGSVPAPPVQCRTTTRVSVTFPRRKRLAPRRIQLLLNGRQVRRYGKPRLRVTLSLSGRPPGTYRVVAYARYRDGRLLRRAGTYTVCPS